MKITRYPQSCLKIEDNGHALLVDVGTLATAKYAVKDFGAFDAVLFTHSHADHFDVEVLGELAANGGQLYGNDNVAQSAGKTEIEVIGDKEEFVVAGFKVKTALMEHCLMSNGSPAGIPNTSFLINDRLLLPGDSTQDIGIKADIVALPIFGPDISLKDAVGLAHATKAQTLIPVHYDVASMDPAVFERLGGKAINGKIIALKSGESTEV